MTNKIKTIWPDTKQKVLSFFSDYARLFKASKSTALILLIVEIFLGLIVVIEIGIIVDLIDALIGARAIKVVTSDIAGAVRNQIFIFIALVPTLIVHHQFKGVAEKVGRTLRHSVFLASMILVALPVAPFFLIITTISAYLVEYASQRWVHWIFSLIIVGFAAIKFENITNIAVYSGVTVGQAIYFGSALLIFSGFLALRPYLSHNPKTQ